ncbi:MAG: hypothetical protein ACI9XO_003947 [Paraglaciecola sp.]|jgi:hypothetical protein
MLPDGGLIILPLLNLLLGKNIVIYCCDFI